MSEHIDNLVIGKWYQQANGDVGQCKVTDSGQWECQIIDTLYRRGRRPNGPSVYIVREVQPPVPVLPFPLEAGRKYCTQKPDGSEGPVVTLYKRESSDYWKTLFPFGINEHSSQYVVDPSGLATDRYDSLPRLQITAPYQEPKPPTIAERLEKVRDTVRIQISYVDWVAAMDSIIADVKALEASKP